MVSLEVSPRLMRPGSKVSVNRWNEGSQSSCPGRNTPGRAFPAWSSRANPASGLIFGSSVRRRRYTAAADCLGARHLTDIRHATRASAAVGLAGPSNTLSTAAPPGGRNTARYRTPGANGKRGTNSSVQAVDGIGAGERRDVTGTGVDGKHGWPAVPWCGRGRIPARHLERAAVKLDGDDLVAQPSARAR